MPTEYLNLSDFEYDLPAHLIAQEPCALRDQSKLLYLDKLTKAISHRVFSDLVEILDHKDVLVINDTKVIPARLIARKITGGLAKLLLIKHEANSPGVWQAMVSPIKGLKLGDILTVQFGSKTWPIKIVDIVTAEDGNKRLLVHLGSEQAIFELLRDAGQAPLPPYISRRVADSQQSGVNAEQIKKGEDLERYQTVFAQAPGAVAAPTAGLHFSEELLARLKAKGITICTVTLHVGPGTFKPIAHSIESHHIEPERYWISRKCAHTINAAKAQGRRIIAVGTTSCRALESAGSTGLVQPVTDDSTSLYVRPGYQFKIIDGLITNFHLSKSSLLLLVSAFVGRDALMNTYQVAIDRQYRFYSYGDAMLIL